MLLKDLIKDIYSGAMNARCLDMDIEKICSDSRQAGPGSLFVALKGASQNGHDYIQDVIKRGAQVIVQERDPRELKNFCGCVLTVQNSKEFLKELLQRFYNYPGRRIKTIGITGTNGKTTVTYLLESVFKTDGKGCGVIGTVSYRYADKIIQAKNTTPGMPDIYKFLAQMAHEGMDLCAMEVSSHALEQGRVEGIDFYAGVFTNLTSDHLDYHQTQEQYFYAKAKLFQGLSHDKVAIVNVDDPWGRRLIEMTTANVLTYGIHNKADYSAHNIAGDLTGLKFTIKNNQKELFIQSALIGIHNVYNILAASTVCLYAGIAPEAVQKGIKALMKVPGRMEAVETDKDFYVFVDYAHTEDALRHSLNAVRNVAQGGMIILVFGCGGDRDRTKRPKMGQVASQLADYSIITNDNPRSEEPQDIIDEIAAGFEKKNFRIIPDRQNAILAALKMAQPQDIVLIAGKGHEDYQIFKDRTVAFDERAVIRELLSNL